MSGTRKTTMSDRQHGRWEVECKNRLRCSNCGAGRNTDTQIEWNYCPRCGAVMDLPNITSETMGALLRMGAGVHKNEI
jgi:predicted RNA-binding Zn-ribbon protein involved in translation (DUF1610 family)